jgi:hypothetical protein
MRLTEGMVRVFANAGFGPYAGQRWHDIRADHPELESWLAAGLISYTGPRGTAPPAVLQTACCGAGALGWG